MTRTKRVRVIMGVVLLAGIGWMAAGLSAPHKAGAYAALPPPAKTGAQGENTCNTCHNGSLNDGIGSIVLLNVPASYVPGQTYGISVLVEKTGKSRWGFEMTCLKNSDNTAAGIFLNGTPFTGTQSSGGRNYISQTTLGGSDGTYANTQDGTGWVFAWTAPAQGTGAVTFSAVGVAADNSNDADSGDDCYTATATSTEDLTSPVTPTTWGAIKRAFR